MLPLKEDASIVVIIVRFLDLLSCFFLRGHVREVENSLRYEGLACERALHLSRTGFVLAYELFSIL